MGAQLNGLELAGINMQWYNEIFRDLFNIPTRWRLRWDLF